MNLEEFFTSIDYTLLREQKEELYSLIETKYDGRITEEEATALEGVMHLLDKLQDVAVDELHFSEEKVFGFKKI